jgi:hypothetical protein
MKIIEMGLRLTDREGRADLDPTMRFYAQIVSYESGSHGIVSDGFERTRREAITNASIGMEDK